MGKSESSKAFTWSDSGYGDDASERSSSSIHPLARKGYEIGPASKLQIGDVFEFLWADCPEFEWEWKCLGYTRFIVLRHSDSFPHYCACVPISVGGRRDFAKPGVDSLQQGYVYASGERDKELREAAEAPGSQQHQHKNHPQLPYSSVSVNLRGGRHRVKEDSRANYADVVEVDHEAQVMVVGDVARYFDRVRKNVNKAFMRQVLRDALGPYCQRKKSETAAAGAKGWGNSAVTLTRVNDDGPREAAEAKAGQESTDSNGKRTVNLQADDIGATLGLEEAQNHDGGVEESFSDGMSQEDEWDSGRSTPAAYSPKTADSAAFSPRPSESSAFSPRPSEQSFPPRSSEERRSMRAASRSRAPSESRTAVRVGMDKAGLGSLRSLRQGLPGGDEADDARSLRSLAMVGRSESFSSSRRSRR